MHDKNETLVSICCLAYNHAPYIRQCLDGFMMQKTDFLFEVLIHDDASTDATADIIREYEQKYPDIIKPIYQTENQHSKGVKISATYNWPRAKGKYIAICEGDDYWTDPLKLQKQADILENNENISSVYTKFQPVDAMNNNIDDLPSIICNNRSKSGDIFIDLLQGNFILTLTICFRKSDIPDFYYDCKVSVDYLLFLCLASKKEFYYIEDITGCYRIHHQSMMRSQRNYVEYVCFESLRYIIYLFLTKKIQRKGFCRNYKIFLIITLFIFTQCIMHRNINIVKLLFVSKKLLFLFPVLLPVSILYKIVKKIGLAR